MNKKPVSAHEVRRAFLAAGKRRERPCDAQTEEQIAEYYRTAEIGAAAVIRNTHWNTLEYIDTAIDSRNNRLGRVYLTGPGYSGGIVFFLKSGRNCFNSTGQSCLVVPTRAVMDWIENRKTSSDAI